MVGDCLVGGCMGWWAAAWWVGAWDGVWLRGWWDWQGGLGKGGLEGGMGGLAKSLVPGHYVDLLAWSFFVTNPP